MATVNLSFLLPLACVLFVVIFTPSFSFPARTTLEKEKRGDSSHWCCDRDLSPVTVQVSRKQVERYIKHENYTYIFSYEPCDDHLMNVTVWDRCPVYKTSIVDTPMYRLITVTLNKTEVPTCPEDELHCCEGFTLFSNDCVDPEKLKSLQALIVAGIIG